MDRRYYNYNAGGYQQSSQYQYRRNYNTGNQGNIVLRHESVSYNSQLYCSPPHQFVHAVQPNNQIGSTSNVQMNTSNVQMNTSNVQMNTSHVQMNTGMNFPVTDSHRGEFVNNHQNTNEAEHSGNQWTGFQSSSSSINHGNSSKMVRWRKPSQAKNISTLCSQRSINSNPRYHPFQKRRSISLENSRYVSNESEPCTVTSKQRVLVPIKSKSETSFAEQSKDTSFYESHMRSNDIKTFPITRDGKNVGYTSNEIKLKDTQSYRSGNSYQMSSNNSNIIIVPNNDNIDEADGISSPVVKKPEETNKFTKSLSLPDNIIPHLEETMLTSPAQVEDSNIVMKSGKIGMQGTKDNIDSEKATDQNCDIIKPKLVLCSSDHEANNNGNEETSKPSMFDANESKIQLDQPKSFDFSDKLVKFSENKKHESDHDEQSMRILSSDSFYNGDTADNKIHKAGDDILNSSTDWILSLDVNPSLHELCVEMHEPIGDLPKAKINNQTSIALYDPVQTSVALHDPVVLKQDKCDKEPKCEGYRCHLGLNQPGAFQHNYQAPSRPRFQPLLEQPARQRSQPLLELPVSFNQRPVLASNQQPQQLYRRRFSSSPINDKSVRPDNVNRKTQPKKISSVNRSKSEGSLSKEQLKDDSLLTTLLVSQKAAKGKEVTLKSKAHHAEKPESTDHDLNYESFKSYLKPAKSSKEQVEETLSVEFASTSEGTSPKQENSSLYFTTSGNAFTGLVEDQVSRTENFQKVLSHVKAAVDYREESKNVNAIKSNKKGQTNDFGTLGNVTSSDVTGFQSVGVVSPPEDTSYTNDKTEIKVKEAATSSCISLNTTDTFSTKGTSSIASGKQAKIAAVGRPEKTSSECDTITEDQCRISAEPLKLDTIFNKCTNSGTDHTVTANLSVSPVKNIKPRLYSNASDKLSPSENIHNEKIISPNSDTKALGEKLNITTKNLNQKNVPDTIEQISNAGKDSDPEICTVNLKISASDNFIDITGDRSSLFSLKEICHINSNATIPLVEVSSDKENNTDELLDLSQDIKQIVNISSDSQLSISSSRQPAYNKMIAKNKISVLIDDDDDDIRVFSVSETPIKNPISRLSQSPRTSHHAMSNFGDVSITGCVFTSDFSQKINLIDDNDTDSDDLEIVKVENLQSKQNDASLRLESFDFKVEPCTPKKDSSPHGSKPTGSQRINLISPDKSSKNRFQSVPSSSNVFEVIELSETDDEDNDSSLNFPIDNCKLPSVGTKNVSSSSKAGETSSFKDSQIAKKVNTLNEDNDSIVTGVNEPASVMSVKENKELETHKLSTEREHVAHDKPHRDSFEGTLTKLGHLPPVSNSSIATDPLNKNDFNITTPHTITDSDKIESSNINDDAVKERNKMSGSNENKDIADVTMEKDILDEDVTDICENTNEKDIGNDYITGIGENTSEKDIVDENVNGIGENTSEKDIVEEDVTDICESTSEKDIGDENVTGIGENTIDDNILGTDSMEDDCMDINDDLLDSDKEEISKGENLTGAMNNISCKEVSKPGENIAFIKKNVNLDNNLSVKDSRSSLTEKLDENTVEVETTQENVYASPGRHCNSNTEDIKESSQDIINDGHECTNTGHSLSTTGTEKVHERNIDDVPDYMDTELSPDTKSDDNEKEDCSKAPATGTGGYFIQDSIIEFSQRSSVALSDDSSDDDLFGVESVFLTKKKIDKLSVRPAPSTPTKCLDSPSYSTNSDDEEEKPNLRTNYKTVRTTTKADYDLDTFLNERKEEVEEEKEMTKMIHQLKAGIHDGGVANFKVEEQEDDCDVIIEVDGKKTNLKKSLKALEISESVIKDQHPGEAMMNRSLYKQLFDQTLTPGQCMFKAGGTYLEKQIEQVPQEMLIEMLATGIYQHCLQAFQNPHPFIEWILHIMSIHPSMLVVEKCYEVLTDCLSHEHGKCGSWVPSVKHFTRMFANLGCDCKKLSDKYTLDYLRLPPVEVPPANPMVDNNCYGIDNLRHILKILPVAAIKRKTHYRTKDIQRLITLVATVSLDTRLCSGCLLTDLQITISALLNAIEQSEWQEAVKLICQSLQSLTAHHHNLVYLVEIFPFTTRGIAVQRRFSLLMLQRLLGLVVQYQHQCPEVKIGEVIEIVSHLKNQLKHNTDFYVISSYISLIDFAVGNESPKVTEKGDLVAMIHLINTLTSEVRECIAVLDRTMIKDKMVRLNSKWTFMLQNMGSKQTTLFDWAHSGNDETPEEMAIETIGSTSEPYTDMNSDNEM